MILSAILKAYRQHHGLSLKELGRITGVCYVTLHRLEHGRPILSTEMAKIWRWILSKEGK